MKAQAGFTAAMSVTDTFSADVTTISQPFGQALVEAGREHPEVVGLTADLGKYTDIEPFARAFPERYFQIGMAEQNLIGIAAGLSRTGLIPFATTYCVFATRRAYDFVAIDVAYGRANVKIFAGLPGLTTGYGATHQGIDDLALMRSMPNMTVIDPCDATEIQQVVRAAVEYRGPVYCRNLRGSVKVVLDPSTYRFEIGKARVLADGSDIALISTGLMTERALEASGQLRSAGIAASVLHVPTVKPLDREAILDTALRTGRVLTMENHSTVNGLGTAVAETLAEGGVAVRFRKLGVPDVFVECGSVPHLTEKYELTAAAAVRHAKVLVEQAR
jgi:transketolase